MNIIKGRSGLFPLLCVLLFSPITNVHAHDHGSVWGQVVDEEHKPVAGIQAILKGRDSDFKIKAFTGSQGIFQMWGIPPGTYSICFKGKGGPAPPGEDICLSPSQTLHLRVVFTYDGEKEKFLIKPLPLDFTHCLHQTILDKYQIHHSPSAHNVWSLVENQDLSATTNRIDVGGLWSTLPALFSSRGSCSWTQNTYLLNGMDVTDPYWTGQPLLYPDFYTLGFSQLINAGLPPQALSPGGYFNLLTGDETSDYQGSISGFLIHEKLQSSNISPALIKEGMTDSHSFHYFEEGNVNLSGPLIPGKLSFFSSLSVFHISRDLADYKQPDKSSLHSGLLSLKRFSNKGSLRLLWAGQIAAHPSFGADRNIPFSSTLDRKDIYNVFQFLWNYRWRENHFFKLGLGFNHARLDSNFQQGFHAAHGLEIFKNIPSGLAPCAKKDRRQTFNFRFRGDAFFPSSKASHRFQYGFTLRHGSSYSQKEIAHNIHVHFFEEKPLEIIKFNTPVEHKEKAIHVNLYTQDTMVFSNFFTVIMGLHFAFSRGWSPSSSIHVEKNIVNWLNLSPRVGLVFPLSRSKSSALKIWAARYYFTLPLHYLTYGNPQAMGGWVYSWDDLNNDGQYQEGEAGSLIRRQGPLFSEIDPELKRPYTDELVVSFHREFSSHWYLTLGAFFRENRNLVETLNIGVPFSAYQASSFYDIGDDRKAHTHDDLTFTVYNQNPETLGQDFFLLTNPESEDRFSRYYGLDLTVVRKYSQKFSFFLSLTATSATGITNPGNTAWENDDGVVGRLYDDPNTLINAKGRMCFDRAYTARLGFIFLAPFGIRVGCIIKYYDGQPFSRKIIVTGMNQGPFYIQAHPRGVSRYEYNRTVDIRLEKIFDFGKTKMRIILDGFNLLNRGLATEENEWTGPEYPLRFATEIQSPRVFRLGLCYEF